ncbi:MAG: hypothetical protein Udaeo2_28540 [Candidatus Udaeobacter sp.]|nr:MAG: hypothetical protein Udaeo2_28540 [Candidatus Udaeobacter sp.]
MRFETQPTVNLRAVARIVSRPKDCHVHTLAHPDRPLNLDDTEGCALLRQAFQRAGCARESTTALRHARPGSGAGPRHGRMPSSSARRGHTRHACSLFQLRDSVPEPRPALRSRRSSQRGCSRWACWMNSGEVSAPFTIALRRVSVRAIGFLTTGPSWPPIASPVSIRQPCCSRRSPFGVWSRPRSTWEPAAARRCWPRGMRPRRGDRHQSTGSNLTAFNRSSTEWATSNAARAAFRGRRRRDL